MAKVMALMNEKGGVGKTTLTYGMAWDLMKSHEKSVLIIDMDGQKANISYLAGIDTDANVNTVYELLTDQCEIADAILSVTKQAGGRLDIIPATSRMSYITPDMKITTFKKIIKKIKDMDKYDYIFLDVNPAPDWKHALTLSVVDSVIIVMLPDVMSLEANRGIFESIEEIKESFNPNLNVEGLLLNQLQIRTNIAKAVFEKAEEMANYYNTKVLSCSIRKSVTMAEAAASHTGVTEYKEYADVAKDVKNLVNECLEGVS